MSTVALGDVAVERRENCKGDKSRYSVVALEHLMSEEITLKAWDEVAENTFTKIFHKGDILFGRRRAYLKKAALAPFDGICSGDITVIEAKPDYILPELLPFVIQNDNFFDFAVGKSAGSLSPRVKWEHLKEYEFNLPSLEEQKRLSKILWSINDTIEAYKKLLVMTDELVKARFVEMFGDMVLNYYHGWEKVSLGSVCDVRDGTHDSPKYFTEGYPLVTSKNVTSGKIDFTDCSLICEKDYKKINERSKVNFGDILMPMIGTVGKPIIVDIDAEFAIKNVALIKFNEDSKVINIFVKALLQSDYFDRAVISKIRGGTQKFIALADIRKLEICLPPMETQLTFRAFVEQSDKSKSELERAMTVAKAMMKRIIAENLG